MNKTTLLRESIKAYYSRKVEQFMLWLQGLFLKEARRTADKKATNENCYVYVFHTHALKYEVLTSRQLKHTKKMGVSFLDIREKAEYVAVPKHRKRSYA